MDLPLPAVIAVVVAQYAAIFGSPEWYNDERMYPTDEDGYITWDVVNRIVHGLDAHIDKRFLLNATQWAFANEHITRWPYVHEWRRRATSLIEGTVVEQAPLVITMHYR